MARGDQFSERYERQRERKRRERPAAEAAEPGGGPRPETPVEPAKSARTVGRNDPCPCGSGKKYKKCCRGAG